MTLVTGANVLALLEVDVRVVCWFQLFPSKYFNFQAGD